MLPPLNVFRGIILYPICNLDLQVFLQCHCQKLIPDVPEHIQRLIALCGIEEDPVVWIAHIQFWISRIAQELIHMGQTTICILWCSIVAFCFHGFLCPKSIEGQQYQPLAHPLIRHMLAAQDSVDALSVWERVLDIDVQFFENRSDGTLYLKLLHIALVQLKDCQIGVPRFYAGIVCTNAVLFIQSVVIQDGRKLFSFLEQQSVRTSCQCPKAANNLIGGYVAGRKLVEVFDQVFNQFFLALQPVQLCDDCTGINASPAG